MRKGAILYLLITLLLVGCTVENSNELDLRGDWYVKLDSLDIGISENWAAAKLGKQVIQLPGTLDDACIGRPNTRKPAMNNYVLSGLSRKHQYIGAAWYQKEIVIPENWEDKIITLELERIIWESKLYIDGKYIGSEESLTTPHRFDLSNELKPGKHILSVRVDNSNKYPGINLTQDKYPDPHNQDMAHAYTNQTQIKWNGILGNIKLSSYPKESVENLQVYCDVENGNIRASFDKSGTIDSLRYQVVSSDGVVVVEDMISNGASTVILASPSGIKKWDEFNPELYIFKIVSGQNTLAETQFGYSQIGKENGVLTLNGRRIFLRGNLECAIFPLTGHPPLEKEGWAQVIRHAKEYGLNHLRFHSWCPPKAAFEAADEAGFYYQVELPHWSLEFGEDADALRFLQEEGDRILKEYGNHPSFILMALGNELEGDVSLLNSTVADLKEKDNRHLYMTTCYSFQRPLGLVAQEEDDYFVTQRTDKGWVRGQGIFNSKSPNFSEDYTAASEHVAVPLISHEIGQYSVYPDMSEIARYSGVLTPLNFLAIKNELEEKGLMDLSDDFTYASGKLAAMLYKEEIERALKTPSFDGFQLLQLQDFPGQGTALVGLLNAFWESKGVISAEEFKQFNSELVPLVRFEKAVYENGEVFRAQVEVSNFYKELNGQKIQWQLSNDKDEVLYSGNFASIDLKIGNNRNIGNIDFPVKVEEAQALTLEVSVSGTSYKNTWPIWVYPRSLSLDSEKVVFTQDLKEAEAALTAGKTVLFNPEYEKLEGINGRFGPVFWSPVHFPNNPTSMGLLLDDKHAAFNHFPSNSYTEWQWWDLCQKSKTIDCDSLNVDPLVRVIDNFVTNRKLANVFEAKVGSGKLVFCSIDISNELESRPVARQLRYSLLNYMESATFDPEKEVRVEDLDFYR